MQAVWEYVHAPSIYLQRLITSGSVASYPFGCPPDVYYCYCVWEKGRSRWIYCGPEQALKRESDISISGSRQVVVIIDFMNMLYLTIGLAWTERIFLILNARLRDSSLSDCFEWLVLQLCNYNEPYSPSLQVMYPIINSNISLLSSSLDKPWLEGFNCVKLTKKAQLYLSFVICTLTLQSWYPQTPRS
jgi:hypothetical protein